VTISCQPDGRPPQPVRPWKSGRVRLAEGSNVVVLEQEIRSVELGVCPMQLFHFLTTSWKSDDFTLRYGDISIFKMSAVRHLGIVLQPYETTHEVPVKFHVNLIHRSEDTAVWIFAYLAWNAYLIPQNWGFGGLWTPNCDYSSSRPPKGTFLRKSASFKLSTVKICWGVWPVGELTESVVDTDTQTNTHTGKFILCPCKHWTDK